MKSNASPSRVGAAALVAAGVLLACASCGGGGGVGSGGTGLVSGFAVGTVNGFGSVIVDGVPYDDRHALAVEEVAPGVDAPADVKLGDRVEVQYQAAGIASMLRVQAALDGPVAATVSASQFVALGQTVRINTDGSAGPVTQFGGGYTQGADVRAGDSIEVHGLLVRQGDSYALQATRIDKLPAPPAYLRVSGIVTGLGAGASPSFALAGLTVTTAGAAVVPSGTTLAVGEAVTVLALPGTAGAQAIQAAQVRVTQIPVAGLDDYVSGSVSNLDPVAKTFALGDLTVSYAAASGIDAGSPLSDGQYVQVRGSAESARSFTAAEVQARDTASDTEAALRGNISASDSATGTFTVRGVSVTAGSASVQGCPASGLAVGLYVEVEGAVSSTGVVASSISCNSEPAGATVEREGVAETVNIAATTFTLLSPESGVALSVQWSDKTFFEGVAPQTLAGAKVQVEGALAGGVLMASKITADD